MKNLLILLVIIVVAVGGFFAFNNYIYQEKQGNQMTNSQMLGKEGKYQVTATDINYFGNAQGYYAYPSEEGQYPGIVMIHEWWGLNDHIKNTARQLASEGYNVLAVDLYNGEVAQTPDQARSLTGGLDQNEAVENMQAAVAFLQAQNSSKIASLGWCFGGRQSVELAISGQQLDATVVYYGGGMATSTEKLTPINWPVLGVFGDQDQGIPVAMVNDFENSLNSLGVENEIYIYEGVGHAFANPSGANYAPEPTMDAWEKTLSFLERHLNNN